MRVVHLIDAWPLAPPPTTLALLADSLGRLGDIEERVIALGPSRLHQDLADLGITPDDATGAPFGRSWLAPLGLRRFMRQLGGASVIHCWSLGAMLTASLRWRRTPRLLTVATPIEPSHVRLLAAITRENPTCGIAAISEALRRDLITGGVHPERVDLLQPALDLSRVIFSQRRQLRAQWGLGEDDRVVVQLCDPSNAGDLYHGIMTPGLAAEARDDRRLWLLTDPQRPDLTRLRRIPDALGRPDRVLTDARLRTPWRVLPGCDLALIQGPAAGGMSMLWAMGANVTIVGEATYRTSEFVEDRHSALLAQPGRFQSLSHQIGQLLNDPAMALRLRDVARADAFRLFSRQTYCQGLERKYRQLVGEIVETEDQLTGSPS